jgi:hypothetical protein
MYHDGLMKLKSQVDFDCLCKVHLLDKDEENGESSWKCLKTLKNNEDRGAVDGNHTNF